MDKFREKSSIQATAWDVYDSCVCWNPKERSKEKHRLRKLSRVRLKEDVKKEIKNVNKE